MKQTILLLALTAGISTMDAETAKTKKTKAAATNVVTPLQIPADAVKTADGYRVVDSKGVAWIYRETPFGVTRAKESAVIEQRAAVGDPDAVVTATREGDTIHFQRPGPFGPTKWDKNVSSLTADEQKIWQRIGQSQRTQ